MATGKKQNTQTVKSHKTAPMLTGIPSLPRLHREGGKGPLKRAKIRVVIEMKYVDMIMTRAAEPIALKAVVEPMLIRDKRQVMVNVINTEFKGMFQPGLTCDMKLEKGRPLSRENAHV